MSAPSASSRLAVLLRRVMPAATGVGMILVWFAVHMGISQDRRFLLPSPGEVGHAFVEKGPALWGAAVNTGGGALLGFGLAVALSFVFALGLSLSPVVRACFYPYLMILQMTPLIVIAPILILWVGPGLKSVVIITFLICFFPMVVNTTQGLISTDRNLVDFFRMCKATKLQDKESILDPQASAQSTLTLAAKLREEIARRNAELSAQRARLSASAPSVRATEDGIAGLSQELERVEAQATARRASVADDGRPLSSVLGAFQQLGDEKTFAEKEYVSALTSLETARMDAAKQQIYLATIVSPGKPEEPSFPRPPRDVAIVFGVALAVWLVGLLAFHSVREHM